MAFAQTATTPAPGASKPQAMSGRGLKSKTSVMASAPSAGVGAGASSMRATPSQIMPSRTSGSVGMNRSSSTSQVRGPGQLNQAFPGMGSPFDASPVMGYLTSWLDNLRAQFPLAGSGALIRDGLGGPGPGGPGGFGGGPGGPGGPGQ